MIVIFEDEIKFAIKYKVTKLDKNNFLLFPICLLKGKEDKLGCQRSRNYYIGKEYEMDCKVIEKIKNK